MVTNKEIQRWAKFGMKLISKISGPEDNEKKGTHFDRDD